MALGTCGKCDGKGKIEAFKHIHNGRCFWCKGSGKLTVTAAAQARAAACVHYSDMTDQELADTIRMCAQQPTSFLSRQHAEDCVHEYVLRYPHKEAAARARLDDLFAW